MPIQPRSLFSPDLETVFHVTKSGWSSTSALSSFCSAVPRDVTLVPALLAELVPLGVEAALDELPVEGERRRDIAAGLRLAGRSVVSSVSGAEAEAAGEAACFFQSAETWRRERAGRFSRLAVSVSKQYAQWASVAMLCCCCGVVWGFAGLRALLDSTE